MLRLARSPLPDLVEARAILALAAQREADDVDGSERFMMILAGLGRRPRRPALGQRKKPKPPRLVLAAAPPPRVGPPKRGDVWRVFGLIDVVPPVVASSAKPRPRHRWIVRHRRKRP